MLLQYTAIVKFEMHCCTYLKSEQLLLRAFDGGPDLW
jgi:hypothetical protein